MQEGNQGKERSRQIRASELAKINRHRDVLLKFRSIRHWSVGFIEPARARKKSSANLETGRLQNRVPLIENQNCVGGEEDQMHSTCEHVRAVPGED